MQNGKKLIPSVTRVFNKGRDLYVYLQAYQPTAAAAKPLVAFVSFYQGQTKVFETQPMAVTSAATNRLGTATPNFSMRLKLRPASVYDCQGNVPEPPAV